MAENKVVLVTGASSGIGKATATAFAREGASVILLDRDVEHGREVEKSLRAISDCLFLVCDVADEAAVEAAIGEGVAHFGGRLDAAFNGAGVDGKAALTADAEMDNWDRIMSVNLKGLWLCMKYELRQMRAQGSGAIVNCASSAGLIGVPGLSAYVASKHGVVGLTRSAALEYARQNIRVNAVCPGMIDTPMWRRSISPEMTAKLLENDPAGRLAQPEEIAAAVVWLCSDAAGFVNGHAMAVDGGMTVD